MNEDEWNKVTDARAARWGALKGSGDWPVWVEKLGAELQAWLEGETVDYVVFGFNSRDDYAVDALDATELTATILTPRFVLHVARPKEQGQWVAGKSPVKIIPRSAITSLALSVQAPTGSFGPAIVTTVDFEGLPSPLQIPAEANDWHSLPAADRVRIFASLRDDLLDRS